MKNVRRIIAIMGCISCIACGGGGGGGSSTADYTGTWQVRALRVINDCGAAVDSVFTNTIVVNQDGSRIVVNSGSRVMQGTANDRDGFTVADVLPASNGCQAVAGYSFSDASDGEADVGVAVIVRCGARECNVAYGGTATRSERRISDKSSTDDTSAKRVYDALQESLLATGGEQGQGNPTDSALNLADLAVPAK
jgi:hypothetical protein